MTGAEVLVGPAFSMLLTAAKEVYKIHSLFKPLVKELIDTLELFEKLIQEIEKSENLDPIQNALRNLHSKMKEGLTLVEKCYTVTRLQFLKKRECNQELVALENALQKRLHVLNTTYTICGRRKRNTVSSYEPPDRPPFTIGLDKPLEELKMWVRKDGEPIFVLTAPGGFGKTTLATEFCHDQDVQGNS